MQHQSKPTHGHATCNTCDLAAVSIPTDAGEPLQVGWQDFTDDTGARRRLVVIDGKGIETADAQRLVNAIRYAAQVADPIHRGGTEVTR
ncbi:hypothetical protein [Rhodococcus ruber]|uniref:hypothetical protein n=1 Tax=Rhodococcus ruber TaxID=1830 RepID=UPI0037839CE4